MIRLGKFADITTKTANEEKKKLKCIIVFVVSRVRIQKSKENVSAEENGMMVSQ